MDNDDDLVREWLAEYKSLPETSLSKYTKVITKRSGLLVQLGHFFKNSLHEEDKSNLISVCHQLFEFYKSKYAELNLFATNLIPSIVLLYLCNTSTGNENSSLGTLLFSIYTLENAKTSDGPGKIEIPQINNPSVYHNPNPMFSIFGQYPVNHKQLHITMPRRPTYTDINAANRLVIIDKILEIYANKVSLMEKASLLQLCDMCTSIASFGFSWCKQYISQKSSNKRISINAELSVTLLRSVYFALYNDCWREGFDAVEAMQRRARKEASPKVLLLCNAILNSAKMEAAEEQKNHSDSMLGATVSHTNTFGFSANLTPILQRSSSRKFGQVSRLAVTAKSIRDHRWRHKSEEVSGDYSESIQTSEIQNNVSPHHVQNTTVSIEIEDNIKSEKHVVSPAKLIKSKLKKVNIDPSPQSLLHKNKDKNKVINPSCGERKLSKKSHSKSQDEADTFRSHRLSKHSSLEENASHSIKARLASSSFSKSTSDPIGPTITGNSTHSYHENNSPYNDHDSPSRIGRSSNHNVTSPLLSNSTSDTGTIDTSSDGEKMIATEKTKESIPLLVRKNSKNSKESKSLKQGTKL